MKFETVIGLEVHVEMATASKIVIAEVDELVETGTFAPEEVVTPHLYVDYVVINKYIKKGGRYVESI